jgi:elongation factor 3
MPSIFDKHSHIFESEHFNVDNHHLYDQCEFTAIENFKNIFHMMSLKRKKLKNIKFEELIEISNYFLTHIHKWSIPDLIHYMIDNESANESQTLFITEFIIDTVKKYPEIIQYHIPKIMESLTNSLQSLKTSVRVLAENCVEQVLLCCKNKDIVPFIQEVVKGIQDVGNTDESIEKLAGCIFVQNIEYPTLCVMLPILERGLQSNRDEVKRKTCIIIENMCKLIEHPKEIIPLLPILEPIIFHCSENVSNPEVRDIATRTYRFIQKLKSIKYEYKTYTTEDMYDMITERLHSEEHKIPIFETEDTILSISNKIKHMVECHHFDQSEWYDLFTSHSENKYIAKEIAEDIRKELEKADDIEEERYVDEEEGENLYSGEFSLAYGSLTLLNNTFLHLKKNRFYGLLGPNNCGKTTLMRAIANEQVDGFPTRDVLKTIFVEHEIEEREIGEDETGYPIFNTDLCGIDWVVECCNDFYKMEPKVTREQVEEVMQSIGFGNSKKYPELERAADAEMPVTTYSGGWKMKMQLCAATLMDADILMLDEPTGHLDVDNIQWLKDFLHKFRADGGSIICTSHDSSFLNEMCTHIVDFQNRKLIVFREPGGQLLEKFVQKYPEKQGYFELKNDVMSFTFPEPGLLDGKKGSKMVLKMNNVTFQYPTRNKPTVTNISLNCGLNSRVAVIGPNGAGKSTAIKLLIGELQPTEGEIWKNTSARIAYVAQHAFQHLEKHIHKTATEYILWRFTGNIDKENDEFQNVKEQEVRQKYYLENIDLQYVMKPAKTPAQLNKAVSLREIVTRRENKKMKTREYEILLNDQSDDVRIWVPQIVLEEMGNMNEVNRYEENLAAQQGLLSKTLTIKNVEKHLNGFGIDTETATHTRLSSLSGGQKVKVVLAASMWMNPHLLILDEPTNYLDRDGLGALTKAIESFKGGVIIISHNREFANAVATEKWIMEKGCLRREGESLANIEEEVKSSGNNLIQQTNTITDSMGNTIKVEQKKEATSAKDIKKQIKDLQKQMKTAKKLKQSETIDDLQFEIDMLKDKMSSL